MYTQINTVSLIQKGDIIRWNRFEERVIVTRENKTDQIKANARFITRKDEFIDLVLVLEKFLGLKTEIVKSEDDDPVFLFV